MVRGVEVSSSTSIPTVSPNSRMSSIDRNIDRDYSYGWSSGPNWKGSSKGNPNAALSALALISFLFFLNLLQQQMSPGQQQTLLFMLNNSNSGRRRRDVGSQETYDPQTDQEYDVVYDDEVDKQRVSPPSMPRLKPPDPAPVPPISEWQAVSQWMQGEISITELPPSLLSVITNCRTVVACTVHQTVTLTSSLFPSNAVTGILSEMGENTQYDDLDEACEDLLATVRGECGNLAKTLMSILPDIVAQNKLKHSAHDLL